MNFDMILADYFFIFFKKKYKIPIYSWSPGDI